METFSHEIVYEQSGNLNPWYVTGFAEGEGSFTYSRSGLQPYFAIKLTSIEEKILRQIQDFFGGIGKIYPVKPFHHDSPGAGKTKAASYFRVSKISDFRAILQHFDTYKLLGLKGEAYLIWRKMAIIKLNNPKSRKHNLELIKLAKELSAISPRNQEWKPYIQLEVMKSEPSIPISQSI